MANKQTLVISGIQWGDEGKGKMTDYLAQKADVVVRFQGGNNAGHTINFDGQKFALQSIPSGIFNPRIINIMANGMVVNPQAVVEELGKLRSRGVKDFRLFISDRAAMVMPWHVALDGAYEAMKGDGKIGTTKKGIGTTYADKYDRNGLRIGDLLHPEYFAERLRFALSIKNKVLKSFGLDEMDFQTIYDDYMGYAAQIMDYICDTSHLLNEEYRKGSKILFEGAQGTMLCIDHGTYPFVTSSSPTAAAVPQGAGIAPRYIDNVLGICKAYTTRVGAGPFPTEISGDLAQQIRDKGHEYGTVTGRPRRIGWIDTVELRHARDISGVDYMSMMLFDVLSGLDKVKICTGYMLDGKLIDYVPGSLVDLERCEPVYEEMDGWSEDTSAIRNYDELPENARKYIERVEELTGIKAAFISVGADRLQTIHCCDIF